MGRKPFNPDLITGPKAVVKEKPLTVAQLASLVRDALAAGVPGKVRVVGEISNFSERNHWFFSLKDEQACIRCVCFASAARKVDFPIEDGIEVVAAGRIDFFEGQGNVQLYVDKLEPVGAGALELKYRALCEELRAAGYFDADRKRELPTMPARVAVITSSSGAALQDVINTTKRRWAGCMLMLLDVRVQGAAAAPEIAEAINAVSRNGAKLGIEAIILTRGGGSIEDLWAFNERIVADAIFRCRLPVVAAIGHETDTTIAELVADVRCSTPTQAAMTLIPDRKALAQQVRALSHRLAFVLKRKVEQSRHRLDALRRAPVMRRPACLVESHDERLATLKTRLARALPRRAADGRGRLNTLVAGLRRTLPRRVEQERGRLTNLRPRLAKAMSVVILRQGAQLASLEKQLEAINPHNVLQRGYSLTTDAEGRVLRSPDQVKAGARITSVLAEGKLTSEVVNPLSPKPAGPLSPPAPKRRVKVTVDAGPTLFT